MRYDFQFSTYQHRFKRPLQTSHGTWELRQGLIVKLTDKTGQMGWGEIAPIPWFGSETVEQAVFCCQMSSITDVEIFSIPDTLPACQFGFESAWESLQKDEIDRGHAVPDLLYSRLLPAGVAALQAWQAGWGQGIRTFKWKIGVASIADELAIFDQLIQALPRSAKLRLDANGGLTFADANRWLERCDRVNQSTSAQVEYLEQPLPPDQFPAMLELSRHPTLIALDESVANLHDLQKCYEQGWRGVFVIKPAIVGSPAKLRQFCQTHSIDAAFSTAFETTIGRQAGLWLAAELGCDRAVGYDGDFHHFDYFESIEPALVLP